MGKIQTFFSTLLGGRPPQKTFQHSTSDFPEGTIINPGLTPQALKQQELLRDFPLFKPMGAYVVSHLLAGPQDGCSIFSYFRAYDQMTKAHIGKGGSALKEEMIVKICDLAESQGFFTPCEEALPKNSFVRALIQARAEAEHAMFKNRKDPKHLANAVKYCTLYSTLTAGALEIKPPKSMRRIMASAARSSPPAP